MKILLADDDPDIRQSTADLLTLHGHAVTQARDGAEALELLARGPFDLLLLDLNMPRLNGLEVLVQARERGTLRCPVIVMTGLPAEWTEGVANVAATLAKGGPVTELLATIRRVCEP